MSKCNCIMEYCPKCHPSPEESKPGFNEVFPPKSPTPAVGKAEEIWIVRDPDDFEFSEVFYEFEDAERFKNDYPSRHHWQIVRALTTKGDLHQISAEEIESRANTIEEQSLGCEPDKIVKRNECRDCGKKWWFELSNCYVCIFCRKTLGRSQTSQSLQTNAGADNGDTARLDWLMSLGNYKNAMRNWGYRKTGEFTSVREAIDASMRGEA